MPRCRHLATRFASFEARAGVNDRPCGFLYGQRLAGQLRFVGLYNAIEQANVRRGKVPQAQMNHIPGNKLFGRDELPTAVAQHARLHREPFAQESESAIRLVFLDKTQNGIESSKTPMMTASSSL